MASSINVLLVGQGAREHALAWKLIQSPRVQHLYVCPGNAGTARLHKVSNVRSVAAKDYDGLVQFAKQRRIGLVVAGPDDAVVDGIEGYFRGSGIPCFAPTKEAAEIEGSKTYAKNFMQKYGIPTANYRSYTNYNDAKAYLEATTSRIVLKVDGLAAGKGVVLPKSQNEALKSLQEMMIDQCFGPGGSPVVIEDYLEGDEISVLSFCDGKTFKSLPPAQDHKRIFDGNMGPNTGGMGVYAPVPFVTNEQMLHIEQTIIQPTLDGLQAEGRTFSGMLFTGIMLTAQGPKVLEYNARFGDPETQALMMLLSPECNLLEVLLACCNQSLAQTSLQFRPGFACNIVLASAGYPEAYSIGATIVIKQYPDEVEIFHAGTEEVVDGILKTAGGRVLSVASHGSSLKSAVQSAYEGVQNVHFNGMVYRKDIASRALVGK